MTSLRLGVLPTVVLAGLIGGCGTTHYTNQPAPITEPLGSRPERHLIDERAGTYGGVGLGASPNTVERALGPLVGGPASRRDPFQFFSEIHAGDQSRPKTAGWLANNEVFFGLKGGQVADLTVRRDGSSTDRGVAIGDPLDDADGAYPGLTCGTAQLGSEYEQYPACTGQVAPDVFIWFGGDPIDAIELDTGGYRNLPR